MQEGTTVRPAGPDPAFEAKVRLVRAVASALERALHSRRLYAPDHPLYEGSTNDLLTRFNEFFAKHQYIRLEVSPTALKIQGRPVAEAPARENEIPFRLYKDGIRELRFHSGITREEILSFIGLMEIDARQMAEMDQDFASLMWTRDLQSVDFTTVDEFDAIETGTKVDIDTELLDLAFETRTSIERSVASARQQEIPGPAAGPGPSAPAADAPTEGPPDNTTVRTAPSAAAEMPDEQVHAIFAMPIGEMMRNLREEIEHETLESAIHRCLDALLQLFKEAGTVTANDISPLLSGVAGFYAKKGDFAGVGHLMFQLKNSKFLDDLDGGAALWKRLVMEVTAPEIRKQMLPYLNGPYAGDVEGLRRYLDIGGPAFMEDVCTLYGRVGSGRTRGHLRDFIIRYGKSVPAAFKPLVAGAGRTLGEVLEIIRTAKPEGLDLERLLSAEKMDPPLRAQLVSVATSMGGTFRRSILTRGIADENANVRTHAFRTLLEARDTDFAPVLQKWIADKDFASRPLDEKTLGCRAFARSAGPSAFPVLKELATRKLPLFNKQPAIDARHAAVIGLGEIGTPEARALLMDFSTGADETLRRPALEALKSGSKP